jgi:CBS domain-containing protein
MTADKDDNRQGGCKMAKIHELMESEVYTCKATDTVGSVIRQLADVGIGSIIIVDDDNHLVGYITDGEIVKYIAHKKGRVFDWGDMAPIIIDEEDFDEKIRHLLATPVIEIATRKKIFATKDQEINEVLDTLRSEKLKKLAVVEDGQVVGLISRSAILRYIMDKVLPDTDYQ